VLFPEKREGTAEPNGRGHKPEAFVKRVGLIVNDYIAALCPFIELAASVWDVTIEQHAIAGPRVDGNVLLVIAPASEWVVLCPFDPRSVDGRRLALVASVDERNVPRLRAVVVEIEGGIDSNAGTCPAPGTLLPVAIEVHVPMLGVGVRINVSTIAAQLDLISHQLQEMCADTGM
jgi:hypothetical protein